MDNHNDGEKLAERVVGDIKKDFTIVGTHRVHSWYAWAIVGIVFGMALGIVYVANRSAQFSASQAAEYYAVDSGEGGVDLALDAVVEPEEPEEASLNAVPNKAAVASAILRVQSVPIGKNAALISQNSRIQLIRVKLTAVRSDVTVKSIIFTDTMTNKEPLGDMRDIAFITPALYVGPNKLNRQSPRFAVDGARTKFTVELNEPTKTPFRIGKGTSRTVTLLAQIYASPQTINSKHVLTVNGPEDIVAYAKTGAPLTIVGTASGPSLKIEPIVLGVAKNANPPLTNRVRKTVDEVATLMFTGSEFDRDIAMSKFRITFSGSALSSPFSVELKNNSSDTIRGGSAQTCSPGNEQKCSVDFFKYPNPFLSINSQEKVTLHIVINSSKFNDQPNTADTLKVAIADPKTDTYFTWVNIPPFSGETVLADLSYK